jgi:peptidoglycan/LPS O-acetylase OafA/YrhL
MSYFLLAPLYSNARSGFIFMFVLGIQSRHGIHLLSQFKSTNLPVAVLTLSLLLCCLVTTWIPDTKPLCWVLEALAAYWLIVGMAAIPLEKRLWVLDNRLTRFLGRISYSFYLWHFPILFILGGYLFSNIPIEILAQWPNFVGNAAFLLSTLFTVPLAWLSYHMVEQPGMSLARKFTSAKQGVN